MNCLQLLRLKYEVHINLRNYSIFVFSLHLLIFIFFENAVNCSALLCFAFFYFVVLNTKMRKETCLPT